MFWYDSLLPGRRMSDETNPARPRVTERQAVLLGLAILGAMAALLMVPGVFTIDENHYLAWLVSLRAGGVTLPGTDGLPRSGELHFFDPVPLAHAHHTVAALVPPLHGPIALAFSLLGWPGLILLNLLAWLVTTGLVYAAARRAGASPGAAAVGGLGFALGGFSLEYAVGVWPHALAACLCLGCFVLALEAADRQRPWLAVWAGLLGGLATGMRYQNVVFAGLVGVVLLVGSARRVRAALAYAAGLLPPLAASAVFNGLRLGSWNPVSKGQGYMKLAAVSGHSTPAEPLRAFAAQVVDFGLQAHLPYWEQMGGRWTGTGALMLLSAVKKALLQSAPWVLPMLVAMLLAWRPHEPASPGRRILRAVAWVSGGMLLLFALAGTRRYDGWCHNARYLFELMPLAGLVLALVVERQRVPWRPLALAAAGGALLALVPLALSPAAPARQRMLMLAPLLLAGGAAAILVAGRWPRVRPWLAPALGITLGWATAVHLGDDMAAARQLRQGNLDKLRAVSALVPEGALAIFAHQPTALGPLLLERDVIIADTAVDQGRDAPALADALLRAHRRVFAVLPNMPEAERRALLGGRQVRVVGGPDSLFVEIGPRLP